MSNGVSNEVSNGVSNAVRNTNPDPTRPDPTPVVVTSTRQVQSVPGPGSASVAFTRQVQSVTRDLRIFRHCRPCDVTWIGPADCWNCDGDTPPRFPYSPSVKAAAELAVQQMVTDGGQP